MTTPVRALQVLLNSGRTAEAKSLDMVSALDHGASVGGSLAANTAAINTALAVAAVPGIVHIPVGVSYTEASLVIPDGVALLIAGTYGTLTLLCKDFGASPIAKGGIAIRSQGHTGVLLRAIDNGVPTDPVLQLVDAVTGDTAAAQFKFAELDEITAPTTPTANKARLYCKDDGSGNTLVVAKFATGGEVQLARQGAVTSIEGSAVYDPGNLVDGAGATTTVTVTGAALGDYVLVSFSLDLQGILLTGYVSSADTVSVRFQNETGGAIDLASGTIKAKVIRGWL